MLGVRALSTREGIQYTYAELHGIWGQGLGLVTPFLLSPGTRGRAAANAQVRTPTTMTITQRRRTAALCRTHTRELILCYSTSKVV